MTAKAEQLKQIYEDIKDGRENFAVYAAQQRRAISQAEKSWDERTWEAYDAYQNAVAEELGLRFRIGDLVRVKVGNWKDQRDADRRQVETQYGMKFVTGIRGYSNNFRDGDVIKIIGYHEHNDGTLVWSATHPDDIQRNGGITEEFLEKIGDD